MITQGSESDLQTTAGPLLAGGVPGDPEEPGLPPMPSEPGEPTLPDQPPPAPVA
jgi:hypothetical protein